MTTSESEVRGSCRLRRLARTRVEEAMHPGVISCVPETPLRDVARILATKQIHCLVVADPCEPGVPPDWGVIAGLDLVDAATDAFDERTAADVAATELVTVSADDPLDRAARLLIQHRVTHLIVVGAGDGRPVGVLSTLDITGVMAWGEA